MAYVFHNRNENNDKYYGLVKEACWIRNMGILLTLGLIVCVMVVPFSLMSLCVIGFGVLSLVYLMYKHGNVMNEAGILASGVSGENRVFDTLRQLPDEYVVATNVPISYGENRSEVDALVMSPYGMYVVEVKNHKGLIEGNCSDRVWKQYKNNGFDKTLKNPVLQMRNQKRILFGMNKKRKLSVPINGLVVFPSASNVSVGADDVLYGLEDLNSFVMEKNQVRVKPVELCRVIKAYGIDLNMVIYDLFAFYKKNCPELLEGIGG